MVYLYIVVVLVLSIFVFQYYLKASINTIFYPQYRTEEDIINSSLKNGDFDNSFFDLEREEFYVKSKFGYDLYGFYLKGNSSKKTIIFSHGIKCNSYSMIKYMPFFRQNGFNVVFYDQRSHGKSGGEFPTYGYYEKHDLKSIELYTMKIFPDTEVLGVFGESLGAATVIQYLPLAENISFAVADCPYSDLKKEIVHIINGKLIPSFIKNYLLKKTISYIETKSDLILEKISPEKSMMLSNTPLLLVHGLADRYVPTSFSEKMYEDRKNIYYTELLIVKDAKHAQSIKVDREVYEDKLASFLKKLDII